MVNERNDDGFQLVKYNSRRQRTKAQLQVNSKPVIVECDSVDEILDKINSALLKFKESQFHQTLINEVKKILITLNSTGIDDIICYGLGNFSQNNSSKYQLAALLLLKTVYSANTYIYDPLFFKNEIASLKQLSLQVIEKNEGGKRVLNNCTTLVFMPHCSKQLTNNFLYANWSPLIRNCILLGNSWSELECHTTNTLLKQTAYYIYKLKPYVTEIVLRNNFEYTNIFNGTSLHIFLKDKLGKIPVDFWDKTTSLLCSDNDPEFIDSPYNFQEEK